MDWSSLLSALIGGFFALAGVLISLQWSERSRRATRLDELATACRALGMEAVEYLRAQQIKEYRRIQPALQANSMSLEAHLKRWEGNRARRGFAATVHSIAEEIAAASLEDLRPIEARRKYIEALEKLVTACVGWESNPNEYRDGDISRRLGSDTP